MLPTPYDSESTHPSLFPHQRGPLWALIAGLAVTGAVSCSSGESNRCDPNCFGFADAGESTGGTGAVGGAGGAGVGGSAAVGGTGGQAAGGTGGQAVGGAGGGTGGAAGTGGGPGVITPVQTLAAGISVSRINIYQGVEIPLLASGGAVSPQDRNADVVARRGALIRVLVDTSGGWQPREVRVQLEIAAGGMNDLQEISRTVLGATNPANFQESFNFEVASEWITENTTYRVRIGEVEPSTPVAGDTSGAEWPSGSPAQLGAVAVGPLTVKLVPLINNGITPDLSPPQLERYRRLLFSMMPTEEVVFTVDSAVDPGIGAVQRGGGNWSETLDFLMDYRLDNRTDSREFYYGVLQPASSFSDYCQLSCQAGFGFVADPANEMSRVAVGLGYFPDQPPPNITGAETLIHELGHNLGRSHAPCKAGEVDDNYPYSGGGTGVLGYDLLTGRTFNPGTHTDILGYCDTRWISDYHYQLVLERLQFINSSNTIVASGPAQSYRVITVDDAGELEWGRRLSLTSAPIGRTRTVDVVNSSGQVTGELTGTFLQYDHDGGGLLVVAERDLDAVRHEHGVRARFRPNAGVLTINF